MPDNDIGIVVKYAVDIIFALKSEGGLVILQKGADRQLCSVAPGSATLREYVITRRAPQTERQTLDLPFGVECESDVLHEFLSRFRETETHRDAATHDSPRHRIKRILRIADYQRLAILQQSLKHLIAVRSEMILHAEEVFASDSLYDILHHYCHILRLLMIQRGHSLPLRGGVGGCELLLGFFVNLKA